MRTYVLALLALPAVAFSQFTNNPSSPLTLGDGAGEQVQPKIKANPMGGSYVSWFDGSGGYDVRLQRLNHRGSEQWAHNGVFVADRQFSSTVDYDMAVDDDGNCYLAFNDNRPGGNQITVAKIDPNGNPLWGANGVTLTTGSTSVNNPKVCILENGMVGVGWSSGNNVALAHITSLGVVSGTTSILTETGHILALSDLEPGEDGNMIALFYRSFTTNFMSSKWLYLQKFDGSNNPIWPTGSAVNGLQVYAPTGTPYGSQGGSIQTGYFPLISSDLEGGAVISWYENAGPRNAYVQHIDAQGHALLSDAGVVAPTGSRIVATAATRMRISAAHWYDRWSDQIYAAAVEADVSPQGNYSVVCNVLDKTGARLYGETGTTVFPINGFQKSFVLCGGVPQGLNVFGFDATSGTTNLVESAGTDNAGAMRFGSPLVQQIDNRFEAKSRLDATTAYDGSTVLAWGNGAFGTVDIAAGRQLEEGNIGNRLNTLSGHINLQDFVGRVQDMVVTIDIDGEKHWVRLNSVGDYKFDTSVSNPNANVRISGPHWLTKQLTVNAVGFTIPAVSLINGDVDGDNEVGLTDFGTMSAAFGTFPGDLAWSRRSDLDGDREVGLGDFGILSANFGQLGD